jgi:glycine dehydrogenase subunit 1
VSASSIPGPAGYLSVTDADRDAMLDAIGVASIDELFEQIPEGVRLGRALDVPEALPEAELVRHLEELSGRNVDTSRELSFLGMGIYDHYVPAVVDTFLSRGELLTAYTPYQPEMSQGVLQAIFEYQTAICELTAMDVSNASGYDGATVAADACFMARAHTGSSRIVLAETLHPIVRQVVKTYAPGFGMEVVEVPHEGGTTDPERFGEASRDAAIAIFQQPNAFGCLEPAPDLSAAAAEGGALPVAHVDPASLGVLEAPGNYGCAMAIGEGQSIGNYQSYGGPHYGFLAARSEFIRRMPGRIVGETTDLEGRRGFVLTLQTREQHIRREKATSNMTTNQTLLALGGLITLCWLGPEGLRELGETCTALAAYAKERVPLPAAFDRPTFKEVAFRTPVPARDVVTRAREHGVHPGYPLGRDYPGLDDVLLVALTEKRTPADVDRLAEVLAEVTS